MAEQVLVAGIVALLILLLPDLVVFFRTQTKRPPGTARPSIRSIDMLEYEIDVIVPVRVPEDETFVIEWPHTFNQGFFSSGGRLLISSNGRWSKIAEISCCRLVLIHTEEKGSKIDNLEDAIAISYGNIIAIFDADSRPAGPIDFSLIFHHIAEADCVQGSNIATSQGQGLLDLFCEYESLLSACVSETFASGVESTSQFRGTNAYFRAETLKELRFQVDTALEDIDATIRLLARGGKIRFDPRLLAIEAAPAGQWELLKQRIRWSLGWGHLCRIHLFAVLTSKHLGWSQKFRIAGYLIWITFLLPVAATVILIMPWTPVWLLAAVLAKFATSEVLVRTHTTSSRMSGVFEASSRSRNTSLLYRILFSAQLLFIDFIKSFSIFGFALGKDSNWPATRKIS